MNFERNKFKGVCHFLLQKLVKSLYSVKDCPKGLTTNSMVYSLKLQFITKFDSNIVKEKKKTTQLVVKPFGHSEILRFDLDFYSTIEKMIGHHFDESPHQIFGKCLLMKWLHEADVASKQNTLNSNICCPWSVITDLISKLIKKNFINRSDWAMLMLIAGRVHVIL